VSVGNNMNVDPDLTDQGVKDHASELVEYVKEIAEWSVNYSWQYDFQFPPAWPLPEDLAYSNTALINGGTDGYAIGDLNWFPEQRAEYKWVPTGIEQDLSAEIPEEYQLSQNYPNPFNPTTTINFSVSQSEKISLRVYNILGQLVSTLVDGEYAAGNYKVNFDATSLSSGMYFYTLQAGNYTATKKMILLK
jgi:hypothetical protein